MQLDASGLEAGSQGARQNGLRKGQRRRTMTLEAASTRSSPDGWRRYWIGGCEMETHSLGPHEQARLQVVEEHVRLENSHNLEGVLGTFGPDARYDDEPWDDHRVGRDQVQSYYKELMDASSDFRIDVVNRFVAAEAVILDVILSGTHTGPWRGLPATGRPFRLPLCGIFTFDSQDRIFGEKMFYDRATVLRQLGVFREPVTALGRILIAINHPLTLAEALARNLFRH